MDHYTIRGCIYGSVRLMGLVHERFFVNKARLFLVLMYSLVAVFSLYCIIYLKDSDADVP
jgi:hypothetical protein